MRTYLKEPEATAEWRDRDTEVFTLKPIQLLSLGVTIPAGVYCRVIRRIACDAAEVEYRGTQWVEIGIVPFGERSALLEQNRRMRAALQDCVNYLDTLPTRCETTWQTAMAALSNDF